MASSNRWANLGAAAGAAAAVLFALFDLIQWAIAYSSDKFHNDFTFYYAAARIGLTHGWPSIYELGLMQQQLDAMDSHIKIAALARYISPPPLAWIALPLTGLPFPVAYLIWSALGLAALILVWWLAAPGRGPVRLIHLAAALGWLPVVYCLQLGQPGLFVALGVAGSYALLVRGRTALAGVALGALVLKPQLAILVPPALFIAGRYRTASFSVLTIGILALASALVIETAGISTYAARLSAAAGFEVNRELTLAALIGDQAPTRVVELAIAGWTMFLAYRLRRREPEWVYVTALVGGLLASPYLHLDDLLMLGVAAWLLLRTHPPAWVMIYLLVAAVAVEGEPSWGPLPLLAAELGALGAISVAAFRPGAGPSTPHDGPHRRQSAEHLPAPPQTI